MLSKQCFSVLLVCIWLLPDSAIAQQTPSLQDLGELASKPGPATIYIAREFLTMDPQRPKAEAIAVQDGRFVAVGSLDEVRKAVGEEAKVERALAEKTVIAGFVEQHVHPVLAALTMNTKVISIEDWDAMDGFSPAVRDPKGYELRSGKRWPNTATKLSRSLRGVTTTTCMESSIEPFSMGLHPIFPSLSGIAPDMSSF